MKIAVAGKGGVGKTTIAGTLARLFAREAKEGETVVAVDADPAMNLKFALGVKENPAPISELKDLIFERTAAGASASASGSGSGSGSGSASASASAAWTGVYRLNPKVSDIIERYGAKGPDGVTLLVMGTVVQGGTGCVCPENAFLRALLRHLLFKERESTVVLDMEAGVEHLGRGTAKGVDLMLAVVEPGMRSVETVDRIKKLAEDIGIKKVVAVLNKVTDSGAVEKVEAKLREFGIPLLETIPYEQALVKADLEGTAPLDAEAGATAEVVGRIKRIKEKILLFK